MSAETDLDRMGAPLLEVPSGQTPTRASQLTLTSCDVTHARILIGRWHSRLPRTQAGPWEHAHRASFDGITYAVALWNSPSARMIGPGHLELRRLAVADDAPHCTASWMLSAMTKWLRRHRPDVHTLLSYQDTAVHQGTIYLAAGWTAAYTSKPRVRDRSGTRAGTSRPYRSNLNGAEPDASAKVRWELRIR